MGSENNTENSLAAKFSNLAAIKKQQAAEYQAKEKAERDRNNILLRWKAIRDGTVLEDESTQAELELYASVSDLSLLALDDEGHICLLSSLQKEEQEKQAQPASQESSQSDENTTLSEEEQQQAAMQRRQALAAALAASRKSEGGEATTDANTASAPMSEKEPVSTEEEQREEVPIPSIPVPNPLSPNEEPEDNTPINEDAKVLRIENIGINEARVYISAKSNPDTNECAYGLYVEQGYGESRQVFIQGERLYNISPKNMAFRAATVALTPYSRLGQPIRQVYLFIDHDLGWDLMKNSWNLVTEAYSLDAETYCQTFKACAGRDVTIRIAPAEASGVGQMKANDICESLIHTPN